MATNEMVKMLTEKSVCDSPFAEKVCYDAGQEIFGFDSANINMVRKSDRYNHPQDSTRRHAILLGRDGWQAKKTPNKVINQEGGPPPPPPYLKVWIRHWLVRWLFPANEDSLPFIWT